MLKFFFWLLLLANAALFSYQHGYLESLLPSGHEPARMDRQLNADRIKLIPAPVPAPVAEPDAAPAPGDAQPAAPAAPAPQSRAPAPAVTTDAVAAAPAPVAPQKVAAPACAEIGNFSADEAQRFGAQLAALAPALQVARRTVQETATHIVYIPSQGNKDGAEKKAGELRRLGIKEFFIIQDDSNLRWGISLGVFKQEEAARAHLVSLNRRGVHSARIGERGMAGKLVAFQLRGSDAETKSALEKLSTGFPKQQVRACEAVAG